MWFSPFNKVFLNLFSPCYPLSCKAHCFTHDIVPALKRFCLQTQWVRELHPERPDLLIANVILRLARELFCNPEIFSLFWCSLLFFCDTYLSFFHLLSGKLQDENGKCYSDIRLAIYFRDTYFLGFLSFIWYNLQRFIIILS